VQHPCRFLIHNVHCQQTVAVTNHNTLAVFFLLKLNLLKLICYCRTVEWSHIDIGGNCT